MTLRPWVRGRGRPWCFSALASLDLACARPAVSPWVHPTAAEWRLAADRLDRLRTALPRTPYTAVVTTVLRDPKSGRSVDGRGAIAVSPGQAVRMILVGAAGVTLLDVWVTPDRFRIAVPPLAMVRRGETESPRDLPVAFLRWWFFARFDGSLFASQLAPSEWLWLLRDGDAVVELRLLGCDQRAGVDATRRTPGHAEHVVECRAGGAPSPGDSVRYVDETSGLEVDLAVEDVGREPPDPSAFRDPDNATDVP